LATQEASSGSGPPTEEQLFLRQLLRNMERSDARMTTLLKTTEEMHRSALRKQKDISNNSRKNLKAWSNADFPVSETTRGKLRCLTIY